LYVNVEGTWLKVFGGYDPNAPGAPTNAVRNKNVITFDAGAPGIAGPTLSYVANIEPKGPTLTFDNSIDPSVGGKLTITGLILETEYTVEIFAVNTAGRGKGVIVGPFEHHVARFSNTPTGSYTDSNNEKWEYYEFKSSSTLNVTQAGEVEILIVDGGKPGSGAGGGGSGASGNGAKTWLHTLDIAEGSHSVVIGGSGNSSSLGSLNAASGSYARGVGGVGAGNSNGRNGNAGVSYSMTGKPVVYGGSGGSGAYRMDNNGGAGAGQSGGVGGAGGGGNGGGAYRSAATANGGPGVAGAANTGGGGGGGGGARSSNSGVTGYGGGGSGGSGIVIVRVKV